MGIIGLAGSASASGPCTFPNGGDWFAVTCFNSPFPLASEFEEYAVPEQPSSTGKSSFAIWGGLQDTGGDTVPQNVLNWNGSSRTAYPEYYWAGNTANPKNINWASIQVYPGDTLQPTISSANCDGAGHCTWYLTVSDLNTDQTSASAAIGSQNVYEQILGGVLEVLAA